MSIIIRLQNLPWSANALDIRQYFNGLQIPEGGVHIVGGELGDAFIAFSTDEDARQAFFRTDGKIKGIQIKLMLSSRTEMQRVIEQARNQSMAAFMLPTPPAVPTMQAAAVPLPAAVPQMIPAAIPEVPRMPAAVPEVHREAKERDDSYSERKRDRRRSRSKSRDRRDRSRDRRDRRHRDRSRSRSRDRRDRRRRDRSRSRNRSRDRESRSRRDIRPRSDDRREDSSKRSLSPFKKAPPPDVWNRPQTAQPSLNIIPPAPLVNERPGILGPPPPWGLEPPMKSNVVASLAASLQARNNLNGFQPPSTQTGFGMNSTSSNQNRSRESWPPANPPSVRESFGGFPLDFPIPPVMANNPNRRIGFNNSSSAPIVDTIDLRDDDTKSDLRPRRDVTKNDLRTELNARRGTAPRENNGKRSRFEDIIDTPVDACVAMEPFYGSYSDLRRFFNGLSINYRGIKVINDEYGHKTGVCFVQFRDAFNKNEAVRMNGRSLNNTQVKIKHISDKVFEEAIDRYNPHMEVPYEEVQAAKSIDTIKDFVCLKVEDLPTFVKEQDILHIFSQHPLISLHLNIKPKGGTVAYVKFSSKEVAKMAFDDKSHHVIRAKPVTVKPCANEEFNQVNMQQVVAFEEPPKPKDIGTDCLNLSKLPSKSNERDISDLFSDIGVVPTKIHLMNSNVGFTGQAYCEFETSAEASKAISKDNTTLGQNTISVQAIPRAEMEAILGKPSVSAKEEIAAVAATPKEDVVQKPEVLEKPPEKLKTLSTKIVSPKEDDTPIIDLKPEEPLPSTTDVRSSPSPPRRSSPILDRHQRDGYNGRRFDRPEYEDFELPRRDFEDPRNHFDDSRSRFEDTRSQFDDTRSFDDFRGGSFEDNFDHPRRYDSPRSNFEHSGDYGGNFGHRGEDFGPRRGHRGSRFGGRAGPTRFDPRRSDSPVDQPMDDERPGCTVFMDNIPYKAGTNEILDFFEGYNSTNNVSRRYNPNNQPSGEAKVTFYTPEEAFRAVRELSGKKIWGRQIFLRQE